MIKGSSKIFVKVSFENGNSKILKNITLLHHMKLNDKKIFLTNKQYCKLSGNVLNCTENVLLFFLM